jgi:hypothetical protein
MTSRQDPDQSDKQDEDPDSHKSEKQDQDPRQSDADPQHCQQRALLLCDELISRYYYFLPVSSIYMT